MFGNPETTTGGRALKFYSSIRVEVRRGAVLKDGESMFGNRTKIKVVKNKVAAPFKECEVDMEFGVSPFPETRRKMIERRSLFDTPGYLWLPAKSRISVDYEAFFEA